VRQADERVGARATDFSHPRLRADVPPTVALGPIRRLTPTLVPDGIEHSKMKIDRLTLPKLSPYAADASRKAMRQFIELERTHNDAAAKAQELLATIESGGYMSPEVREQLRQTAATLAKTASDMPRLQHAVDALDERDVEHGYRVDDARATAMAASTALGKLAEGLERHAGNVERLAKRQAILEANKAEGKPWHAGLTPDLMLNRDVDALDPDTERKVFGRHGQTLKATIRAMSDYRNAEESTASFDVGRLVATATDEASAIASKVPAIGSNWYRDGNALSHARAASELESATAKGEELAGRVPDDAA